MKSGHAFTSYEEEILEDVSRTGCHITSVFDPEGRKPSFAYSAGFLKTVRQPEAIVFGSSSDLMGAMINALLRQCREGLVLADRLEVEGLLDGHRCAVRAVAPEFVIRDYFHSALWYHRMWTGEQSIAAVQLIWPGAEDGLFPWDRGCSDRVRELQPPLFHRSLNS